MSQLLALPLLLAPVAGPLAVQEPARGDDEGMEERVVDELLASDALADVAWGATYAGEQGMRSAIPALLPWLERDADGALEWKAVPYVLDALVRLDAAVDPKLLVDVIGGQIRGVNSPAVLILLAKDPARSRDALLTLLEDPEETVTWRHVVRLLATTGGESVVARIASELVVHLDVTVHDPGSFFGSMSLGGYGTRVAFRPPPGFPPQMAYEVREKPGGGAVQFAGGPLPLYYVRVGTGQGGCERLGASHRDPRPKAVLDALTGLVGLERKYLMLQPRRELHVEYTTDEDFVAKVRSAADGMRAAHASLLEWVEAGGHLTAEERASLRLRIELDVQDRRATKEGDEPPPPLPEVSLDE